MSLKDAIIQCTKCDLHKTCIQKVIAAGVANPTLICVGEAPGAEEDKQGRPFVGNSGQELRKKLDALGHPYTLLNVIKCRPPANRQPTFPERMACMSWLEAQLRILKEKSPEALIVPVGKIAFTALAKDKLKKNWMGSCETIYGPGFAIQHPAAMLHNPEARQTWEDCWAGLDRYLRVGNAEDQPFAHLHVHTEYSYGDSINKIDQLCEAALRRGFKHLAITDHYNMSGVIEFYNECIKRGLNPILGIEGSFACDLQDEGGHITLLAQSYKGLQNIFQAISKSYDEAASIRKPKIRTPILRHHLFAHSEDVVVLTACVGGYIPKNLSNIDLIRQFKAAFPGRFYFEVMPTQVMWPANKELARIGREEGIPLVATNDVHYIKPEYAEIHHTLIGIQQKKKIDMKYGFDGDCYWLKTWDEMLSGLPEDIAEILTTGKENSLRIAESCKMVLPTTPRLPAVSQCPDEDLSALILKCNFPPEYHERAKRELDIIVKKQFSNYFLMIEGIFRYARSQNIMMQCRGSVGGSVIAFMLNWTDVDPIRCEIPFERFLNMDRKGLPDIDIDVDGRYRTQIIKDHLVPTYGEKCVAWFTIQAITFGGKTAANDVSRVFNIDYRLQELIKDGESLKYHPDYPKQAFDHAAYLQGQVKTRTVHPAAVIVCDDEIGKFVPVEYRPPKDAPRSNPLLHCQFSHESCEQIGLVKFDLLCQDCLSIIAKCEELMPADKLTQFRAITDADSDAKVMYEYGEGHTAGVFQVSGPGMKRCLQAAKPKTLGDLADIIALYRPGPKEAGMLDQYLNFKGDELMAPWCHWSRNCIVYQEQVMAILHGMGGMPMEKTDKARSIISKKKSRDMIEKMRVEFIQGASRNGHSTFIANMIFDKLVGFADYAFNKAHAFLYARRSYRTMWLKTYCPGEFIIATMLYSKKDMGELIIEMRQRGIKIHDPDVNTSIGHFVAMENGIMGGLTTIKGIGSKTAEKIIANRPYKSISDLKGVVSTAALITLAQARALRSIEPDHARAISLAERDGCVSLDACGTLAITPILSPVESYIIRGRVVSFPAFDHPAELADTHLYPRIRKLAACQDGVYFVMVLLKDLDTETKRHHITIEDDSGEREAFCWESADLGLDEFYGQTVCLCIHTGRQGMEVVGVADLTDPEARVFMSTEPQGQLNGRKFVTGHIAAVSTFKTREKKEMGTIYIQNREGGVKVMVWPTTWAVHGSKIKKYKHLNNLPLGTTEDGTFFARLPS